MSTPIRFFVEGECIAQPRYRHGRGYDGKMHHFLPRGHKVRPFRDAVALAARLAMRGRSPLDGPVSASILFAIRRPKSCKQPGYLWRPSRPDIDNLAKSVFDAVRGIVYVDDAKIVCSRKAKILTAIWEPYGLWAIFDAAPDVDGYVRQFFTEFHRVGNRPILTARDASA